MTYSTAFRRIALGLAAASLSLGLAACGDKKGEIAGISGDKIAPVAAPAGKAWGDVVSKTAEGGYRMGNPDAPIKLVEYGALSCSHCAEFSRHSAAEMREKFVASGRVSYELRYFMLNMLDVPAVLLATCGAPEAVLPLSEQFWAWQPNMFAALQGGGEASLQAAGNLPPDQRFVAIAKAGGMDAFFAARGIATDQGKACLADTAKATALVEATDKAQKDYEITGTPTFFINGQKQSIGSWAEVKAKLETLGAR